MHARFELPSSISTRSVLAVRVATRQAQTSKSSPKQAIVDVSDSGLVGADFPSQSIFAQCFRPTQVATHMQARESQLPCARHCKQVS
jgi:hypothetical protein